MFWVERWGIWWVFGWIAKVKVAVWISVGFLGFLNFDSCARLCITGSCCEEFTVDIHHGGFYVGSG